MSDRSRLLESGAIGSVDGCPSSKGTPRSFHTDRCGKRVSPRGCHNSLVSLPGFLQRAACSRVIDTRVVGAHRLFSILDVSFLCACARARSRSSIGVRVNSFRYQHCLGLGGILVSVTSSEAERVRSGGAVLLTAPLVCVIRCFGQEVNDKDSKTSPCSPSQKKGMRDKNKAYPCQIVPAPLFDSTIKNNPLCTTKTDKTRVVLSTKLPPPKLMTGWQQTLLLRSQQPLPLPPLPPKKWT